MSDLTEVKILETRGIETIQDPIFVLNEQELDHFKRWLELNLNSITWEGRNSDKFNQFWDIFFAPDQNISIYFKNFNIVKSIIKTGPLSAWFKWLNEKMICYLFIFKPLKLNKLSNEINWSESDVSLVLRDFFIERYPHLDDAINEKFHITDILSPNLEVTYAEVKELLHVSGFVRGSLEEDLMTALEVTLYPEWEVICSKLEGKESSLSIDVNTIKRRTSFKKQIRFMQELFVLFLVGGVLIFGLQHFNKWYESYLSGKISLYEPNFFWLDKSLSFEAEPDVIKDIALSNKELEELERLEAKNIFENKEVEGKRYEVESDVVLTSVDALPKDINAAELEASGYEETRKGGFRSYRGGRRKAYRVLLNSTDPKNIRSKLYNILKDFNVKQVDKVKPGTEIPGGIYFNLYVSKARTKEFLTNVTSVEEETTILESRPRFGGPKDMNRVFIWIKSI